MNVTIVCDVLGEPNNGTTIATLNLIRHLKNSGHRVNVVSADETSAEGENNYVVPTLHLGKFADSVLRRNGVSLAKADEEVLKDAIRDADVVHIQIPFFLGTAGTLHEQTRDGEFSLSGGKRDLPYRHDEFPARQ